MNNWLIKLWEDAKNEHREVIWNSLPDVVLEKAPLSISYKEIDFLKEVIQSSNSELEILAAIRTIGCLVEERYIDYDDIRLFLHSLLDNKNPLIRNSTIEVIWQIRDVKSLEKLENLLKIETNSYILRTLNYVIGVLSK